MKTSRLQAAFARKREAENIRIERTQETNRYFDHWGKVTSRFQTWTTPEYYENAEKSLKVQKEKQFKEEKLNERREKLQKLLETENQQYENELQAIMLRKQSPSVLLSGRRSKYDSIDTNVLEKIKENRAEEMRRLELEAKLYRKWRNPVSGVTLSTTPLAIVGGANDHSKEKSLFESKSDNEIMAKLNWLDKQIENQMLREEEEKETQKRSLKLQEEARKREEIQRERQLIRESEIKELRALQENHVIALKQREIETLQLQQDEEHYRHILDTIETELNSLKLNYENFSKQIIEKNLPHNIKKIKLLFRQLCEEFNDRFEKDIECLNRIKLLYSYAENNDNIDNNSCNSDKIRLITIQQMIEKFKNQYQNEILNQSDICNMYESEAKNNFKKWQEFWYNQETLRKTKIIELLERDQIYYDAKLIENLKQQKIVIEIRETHLSAIENSNEKLKMLIKTNTVSNTLISKNYNNNQINNNDNNINRTNHNNTGSNIFWDNDNKKNSSSRNVSRCSSRISNIHDLNSYREESANSLKNTKSRIFGWIDNDNDCKNNSSDQIQLQLNEKKHFNRDKIENTTNPIDTSIPISINNNNKSATTREDLISDLREKNSRAIMNDNNARISSIKNRASDNLKSTFNIGTMPTTDNNQSFNKSIQNCDTANDSNAGNNMEISKNDIVDSTRRKIESNCSITNDNTNNNLNNSFGPKFGKKKVAWT